VLHRSGSARHLGERRSFVLFALLVVAVVLALPSLAFGYWHSDPNLPPANTREVRGAETYVCADCHVTWTDGDDDGDTDIEGAGPHGYYRTDTNKCRMCHAVHKAPAASIMLLPAATIQAACFTCHDATGAQGVYSGIVDRGGVVKADHSIDTTTHVPGGSADLPGMLTCTSCHTVHRATTMAGFRTDRHLPTGGGAKYSNALLRDDVGGKARGTYTTYSSDWCAGCHDQRHGGTAVVNHPVEASKTADPLFEPFDYGRVATVVDPTDAGSGTEVYADQAGAEGTGLGFWNLGYVMPWPRTPEQTGHAPVCMQCHEDARAVGSVGAVVDFPAEQPRTGQLDFAFPHQTTSEHLLVEEHDDLCLNCHPLAQLP